MWWLMQTVGYMLIIFTDFLIVFLHLYKSCHINNTSIKSPVEDVGIFIHFSSNLEMDVSIEPFLKEWTLMWDWKVSSFSIHQTAGQLGRITTSRPQEFHHVHFYIIGIVFSPHYFEKNYVKRTFFTSKRVGDWVPVAGLFCRILLSWSDHSETMECICM